MKKLIIIFLVFFIISAIVLIAFAYWSLHSPYQGYGNQIIVQIKPGASVFEIGSLLYQKKIINNLFLFKIYYKYYFKSIHLKSGDYLFNKPLSMVQVFAVLEQGKVLLQRIRIQEGLIIEEIADYLNHTLGMPRDLFIHEAKNVTLIKDIDPLATDLEGYLYPDTYLVNKHISAKKLVFIMVKRFIKLYSNSFKWRANEINMKTRDVIILASLIEKEISIRSERFLISSVFHNRLEKGMSLGCDPTIIFILKKRGQYQGNIRWPDLRIDSPYNTRIYKGLPPGPICNVTVSTIEAALYPENTAYLYFVAKDNESHYFSKTLQEHNRAVQKYIIGKN